MKRQKNNKELNQTISKLEQQIRTQNQLTLNL